MCRACDRATKNERRIVIANTTGRLSKDQIARMVSDAQKYAEHDARVRETLDAKARLDNFLQRSRSVVEGDQRASKKAGEAKRVLDEAENWAQLNESQAHAVEFNMKRKDVMTALTDLFEGALHIQDDDADYGDSGGGGGADDDHGAAGYVVDVSGVD